MKGLAIHIIFLLLGVNCFSQWELISPVTVGFENTYTNVHFINADTGFVVGAAQYKTSILKTVDGGQSWDTTVVEDITGWNTTAWGICFPSELVGYVMVSEFLVKTIDGGDSWFQIDTAGTYDGAGNAADIMFINNDTGFVGWADGGAGGLITTDGGWTWQQDQNLLGVRHFNAYNGVITACAEAWFTFNSSNLEWTVHDPINYGYYHYRNSINLNDRIFVVGSKMGAGSTGIFSFTDDLGSSWTGWEFPGRLEDITFLNDTVGYMVGGHPGTVRTTDGGMTWYYGTVDNLGTGMSTGFYEVSFVNDTVGYAVSNDGIYKTTNGGGPYTTQVNTWPFDLGFNENQISLDIFPNPSDGNFTFNSGVSGILNIYNLSGQLIKSINISGQSQQIEVSEIDGLYLLEFKTDQGVVRRTVQIVN